MDAITIDEQVMIPASAIRMTAVRASGPGGQNVNKVSSKVVLRIDLGAILGLSEAARQRLHKASASRLDAEGWLMIASQKTRDQGRNLEDVREKVCALVRKAMVEPTTRKKAKPPRGVIEARLKEKRHTSARKRQRQLSDRDEG